MNLQVTIVIELIEYHQTNILMDCNQVIFRSYFLLIFTKHKRSAMEAQINLSNTYYVYFFVLQTAKSALASRPIAPAPLQQGSHATAAGIIPKLPVGLGITPDVRAVPQQVAVNLSAQVASMTSTSFSVTQSGPTMQSVAITPGSSLHLSGGNLVQPQLTQVKTGINVRTGVLNAIMKRFFSHLEKSFCYNDILNMFNYHMTFTLLTPLGGYWPSTAYD